MQKWWLLLSLWAVGCSHSDPAQTTQASVAGPATPLAARVETPTPEAAAGTPLSAAELAAAAGAPAEQVVSKGEGKAEPHDSAANRRAPAASPGPSARALICLTRRDLGPESAFTRGAPRNLTLHVKAGKQPVHVVVAGYDRQHHALATNLQPQLFQLQPGQAEAHDWDLPAPPEGVTLFASFISPAEGASVETLVSKCSASSDPHSPAARKLYSRLDEWFSEDSQGLSNLGPVSPSVGGVRTTSASSANPASENKFKQGAPVLQRKAEPPAAVNDDLKSDFNWEASAEKIAYGSGRHSVRIYWLHQD